MRIMFPIAATTLTLAAALATFTPVQAAEVTTKSVRVSYADLNLASEAGQAALKRRIKGAIYEICGLAGTDLRSRAAWMRCSRQANASAEPQMLAAIDTAQRLSLADAGFTLSRH